MPVTIKDIAKVAGVSHTTVSRALKSNPVISVETTKRVQELAQQMGYVPNIVARSLNSQQTWTIGMVVTTIADPFVTKVVEGVEQVAQAANYSIFLTPSHNNPKQELAVVETLQRRRVDAIIVTSSRVGSLYSSRLDQIQVPIVLINNQAEGEYLHSVTVDDIQGARLAVEHLLNLGHRRIGYIGVVNRPKSDQRRLAGYQAALNQAHLELDPALIMYPNAESDLERGQVGLTLFLKEMVTAIFCYNDMVAIGLLMACRRQGIMVPDQLSVIGFDDIEPATYLAPPLTTIAQPRLKLGQLAMHMTLDLLRGQKVQDQVLPCKLIARESTGRLKIGNHI
jgi:LacI family transcriptional regulator/LacI family repressor for deo operon, udp, cdd, tsx, nupC, and nupG